MPFEDTEFFSTARKLVSSVSKDSKTHFTLYNIVIVAIMVWKLSGMYNDYMQQQKDNATQIKEVLQAVKKIAVHVDTTIHAEDADAYVIEFNTLNPDYHFNFPRAKQIISERLELGKQERN